MFVLKFYWIIFACFSAQCFANSSSIDDAYIDTLLLQRNYDSASRYIHCSNIPEEEKQFFNTVINHAKLVDYEAYDTECGKKVLQSCTLVLSLLSDKTGKKVIRQKAVILGIRSIVHLKRNSIISGMKDARKSVDYWEKIISDEKYSSESRFAIALNDYYTIALFRWVPHSTKKITQYIQELEKTCQTETIRSYQQLLSLVWVLINQEKWEQAQTVAQRFLCIFPKNTLMIRAQVTIQKECGSPESLLAISQKLHDLALHSAPINWADYLSAEATKILALQQLQRNNEACTIINHVKNLTIPKASSKITWVKKHRNTILKEIKCCQ